MASLTLDDQDCFLGYPSGLLPFRYTNSAGSSMAIDTIAGPFLGEQVCLAGTELYKGFRSTTVETVGCGYKGAIGSLLLPITLSTRNASGGLLCGLRVYQDGSLRLARGSSTEYGTAPGDVSGGWSQPGTVQANTYLMLEMFVRHVNPCSIETWINGLRNPYLTTTDFAPDGPHGQGLFAGVDFSGNPAAYVQFGSSGLNRLGYRYQRTGSGLWKSVATVGTAYSDLSDFHGDALRGCSRVTGNGATYPINAVGGRWALGGTGSPANVAVAVGESLSGGLADGDNGYVLDLTTPTGSALDRVSFDSANLVGTASKVIAVQRNIVARGSATQSPTRLKTGFFQGGVLVYDAIGGGGTTNPALALTIELVDGQYIVNGRPYGEMPFTSGGTTVWSPATHNALESVTELFALNP